MEIVTDLLNVFEPSLAKNSSETVVRRPAIAGKIREDGLFEHPKIIGQPARVDFEISLPQLSQDDCLLFAFDIALADGIQFGKGEDGVGFSVEVDGQEKFRRVWRECRWEPHALELTSLAGRTIRLGLLVDALGNTTYDWATWGNPRLLRFRNARLGQAGAGSAGQIASSMYEGVLAIKGSNGLKLRVIPSDKSAANEVNLAIENKSSPNEMWRVADFNFAGAKIAAIEWTPKDARPEIWIAPYAPSLRLIQSGPTRALVFAGDSVPLHVTVRNEGRGTLNEGNASVSLKLSEDILPTKTLPALRPGEAWQRDWDWKAPQKTETVELKADLRAPNFASSNIRKIEVFDKSSASVSIQNSLLKLEFVRAKDGFAFANVYSRQSSRWTQVAVWRPLFGIISDALGQELAWEIRPNESQPENQNRSASIQFNGTAKDADNIEWRAALKVSLETNRPVARIRYEWSSSAPRQVRALWGPNLYVGGDARGEAKEWGLFPGLEYLYGAERSSNPRDFSPPLDDRRTPHPNKITIPLMAVTIGPNNQMPPEKFERFFAPDSLKDHVQSVEPRRKSTAPGLESDITVALLWDPAQRWDGEHPCPSARFSSPNSDEGMRNHRLGLFLPSAPDFVAENADRASKPFVMSPGKTLTLEAKLAVTPGTAMAALREWIRLAGGLPKPTPWPRSFQEELDVCRAGFMKTLWDGSSEKWRHCIGWAPSHAPGFAALLWLDAQVSDNSAAREQSRNRVELAAKNMLRDGGPGLLTSQANCHIMQWEFPFYYGALPEALNGLEGQIRNLIQTQRTEGGWVYQPGNDQQADLGRAGDSVLGTCANRAATLLRYGRITGDAAALDAGEKALRFMENFRVPRGGQTWECPMYEPDILAAAYAVRAYHDAFRATGNPRWLHDAVYWAETGVPFIYLWSQPDRPMMLGATIPVFGSTFYSHTWLGVPVQWCGLVYAFHVFHLAAELERNALPKTDSPLPLSLNFSSADWRRVAELITASATHQQFGEGERIGAYPDSISNFTQRNPAFINPEDILVNVLALHGQDPDIQTARIKTANGTVVISSGARIERAKATDENVILDLNFFKNESSHTLLSLPKPSAVKANGVRLNESPNPMLQEVGWWWDSKHSRLYVTVQHPQPTVRLEIFR